VNKIEEMDADRMLNKSHLGDVNGLFADISALLLDFDALKRNFPPSEEDRAFFLQVQAQRSRVERLRNILMRGQTRSLIQ
jgi:hypothetical protein